MPEETLLEALTKSFEAAGFHTQRIRDQADGFLLGVWQEGTLVVLAWRRGDPRIVISYPDGLADVASHSEEAFELVERRLR